jgi:hypothetical protein
MTSLPTGNSGGANRLRRLRNDPDEYRIESIDRSGKSI